MTDLENYRNAMQILLDLLNQAFDNADTTTAKTTFNDLANTIGAIVTALNQTIISANTDRLKAIQPNIINVTNQLKAAQTQVNNWVKDIAFAGQIASAMDKAVELAGKAFPV